MSKPTAQPEREWPVDYVRICLRFLALDAEDKRAYLPADFPETAFHMQEADAYLTSPFRFMAALAVDSCDHAATNPDFDETQADLLREMAALLKTLAWCKRADLWQGNDGDTLRTWNALARLAKLTLAAFGWEPAQPEVSCIELLDEYSYGAYSEVLRHPLKQERRKK